MGSGLRFRVCMGAPLPICRRPLAGWPWVSVRYCCLQLPLCLLALDVSTLLPACGRPLLPLSHQVLLALVYCCLWPPFAAWPRVISSVLLPVCLLPSSAASLLNLPTATGRPPPESVRRSSKDIAHMAAPCPAEHAAALIGGSKTLTRPPGMWVCMSTPVWFWTALSACSWRHLTPNSQAAASHVCGS